ncbi:unnamed protein product [Amoebophrya sp. A25]|nr:unnamed protein product [Amoebophrya sp. A25]|eukprot:GSA25T00027486001.1
MTNTVPSLKGATSLPLPPPPPATTTTASRTGGSSISTELSADAPAFVPCIAQNQLSSQAEPPRPPTISGESAGYFPRNLMKEAQRLDHQSELRLAAIMAKQALEAQAGGARTNAHASSQVVALKEVPQQHQNRCSSFSYEYEQEKRQTSIDMVQPVNTVSSSASSSMDLRINMNIPASNRSSACWMDRADSIVQDINDRHRGLQEQQHFIGQQRARKGMGKGIVGSEEDYHQILNYQGRRSASSSSSFTASIPNKLPPPPPPPRTGASGAWYGGPSDNGGPRATAPGAWYSGPNDKMPPQERGASGRWCSGPSNNRGYNNEQMRQNSKILPYENEEWSTDYGYLSCTRIQQKLYEEEEKHQQHGHGRVDKNQNRTSRNRGSQRSKMPQAEYQHHRQQHEVVEEHHQRERHGGQQQYDRNHCFQNLHEGCHARDRAVTSLGTIWRTPPDSKSVKSISVKHQAVSDSDRHRTWSRLETRAKQGAQQHSSGTSPLQQEMKMIKAQDVGQIGREQCRHDVAGNFRGEDWASYMEPRYDSTCQNGPSSSSMRTTTRGQGPAQRPLNRRQRQGAPFFPGVFVGQDSIVRFQDDNGIDLMPRFENEAAARLPEIFQRKRRGNKGRCRTKNRRTLARYTRRNLVSDGVDGHEQDAVEDGDEHQEEKLRSAKATRPPRDGVEAAFVVKNKHTLMHMYEQTTSDTAPGTDSAATSMLNKGRSRRTRNLQNDRRTSNAVPVDVATQHQTNHNNRSATVAASSSSRSDMYHEHQTTTTCSASGKEQERALIFGDLVPTSPQGLLTLTVENVCYWNAPSSEEQSSSQDRLYIKYIKGEMRVRTKSQKHREWLEWTFLLTFDEKTSGASTASSRTDCHLLGDKSEVQDHTLGRKQVAQAEDDSLLQKFTMELWRDNSSRRAARDPHTGEVSVMKDELLGTSDPVDIRETLHGRIARMTLPLTAPKEPVFAPGCIDKRKNKSGGRRGSRQSSASKNDGASVVTKAKTGSASISSGSTADSNGSSTAFGPFSDASVPTTTSGEAADSASVLGLNKSISTSNSTAYAEQQTTAEESNGLDASAGGGGAALAECRERTAEVTTSTSTTSGVANSSTNTKANDSSNTSASLSEPAQPPQQIGTVSIKMSSRPSMVMS